MEKKTGSGLYRTRAPIHRPTTVEEEGLARKTEKQELAKEIEDELDEMLDEIDSILAENEDVLGSFTQVNGE